MSVTLRSFCRLLYRNGLSLIIVVLLVACGGGAAEEDTPTVVATPAAGGMVMPTATVAPPTTVAEPPVEDAQITPGQVLLAVETVRLYGDASRQALVLNQYSATAAFTVLEPSGEYTTYPVTQESTDWYRLRAADGLVGWLPAAELAPSE